MSEMTTPSSFISAFVIVMFGITLMLTWETESLAVFVVGIAMMLFLSRAMIGIGRE